MQQVHHDGEVGTSRQSQKVDNDKRGPEETSLLQPRVGGAQEDQGDGGVRQDAEKIWLL